MGKGHKGKGSSANKPNNKFKQRSPQNRKQLAKVQQILKGRSNSKYSKGNNKGENQRNGKQRSFSRENREDRFQKGNKRGGFKKDNPRFSYNDQNRGRSPFQKNEKKGRDWEQRFPSKTKGIKKDNRNKRKANNQEQEGVIKGNPLFKIIPQTMGDDFAALGGNSQQQQQQQFQQNEDGQMDDDEEMDQQQQSDDEQLEGAQVDGEQFDGEQQEQFQGEDNQEQFDEEQQLDEDQGEEFEQQGNQQEGEQFQQGDEGEQIDEQEHQDEQNDQENIEQQNPQEEEQNFEEEQNNDKEPVDISVISLKIQETIQILMNVARLGEGKPRKHFIQELKQLVHQYYGYNFQLISHFLDFLNPAEMIQFFEANETQRPLTIRTNTLKTRRKQLAQCLIQRGVNLDPLADWSKVGIKIYDTKVPIGATPEYLAGHYMLQSASSLLPVIALDPQVGQKILDMASAPGGKTTYIAQLMKNTGCIFANDLKKERLKALQFNLYRLGVTNTAVTCRDGRKFPSIFPATFDRVLLDAPCTGLGIISKDHSIKANRVLIDIYKNSHLQKELLLAAIDSCKVNGVIVYSTCSVSPLQNQQVVNYALKRRFIKIVDSGVQVGEQGLTKFVQKRFHVDLKKTRRIYPHVHNMDGFYVAKILKVAKGKRQVKEEENEKQEMKACDQNENNGEVEVDV